MCTPYITSAGCSAMVSTSTSVRPNAAASDTTSPLRWKARARGRGQAWSAYVCRRSSAKVRGRFSPHSCGGAYWQAYQQPRQLWQRLAR